MGLMDKFKNLFVDEEIIEEDDTDTVEIKEIKKEEEVNKLPTFMREKIEKEENSILPKKDKETNLEKEIDVSIKEENDDFELSKVEEKKTFKFPLDLTDNDFVETRSRQSIHHPKDEQETRPSKKTTINRTERAIEKKQKKESNVKVADIYKDKRIKEESKSKFKATPIISPIFGVLEQNYSASDLNDTSRNDLESNRHSKNVDFDSVRKKAYGTLSSEIKENLMCENCEYLKEAKECHKEKVSKEEYYSRLDDDYNDNNTYKDITLDEATENYYDYGVEYEKEIEEPIKISNYEEEYSYETRQKKEIPPVKSNINLLSTLKKSMGDDIIEEPKKEENLELTDDLFNLIDSMYDERNE